ncbi:polycystic kidney disease and receptor for egg jelly-related protein isoform X2 [Nematostella vectensis]|uniref:polycystic kidney disease and receptor for egg jelly-related protein isoform X2 n=1 Tax=Nematostella vectensis TaxID=45351 RepID=UPI002076DAA9|nr:polycystic kidney disease and receptor for egg jelly-related protein isoform X2 [Nematostella vectensis]
MELKILSLSFWIFIAHSNGQGLSFKAPPCADTGVYLSVMTSLTDGPLHEYQAPRSCAYFRHTPGIAGGYQHINVSAMACKDGVAQAGCSNLLSSATEMSNYSVEIRKAREDSLYLAIDLKEAKHIVMIVLSQRNKSSSLSLEFSYNGVNWLQMQEQGSFKEIILSSSSPYYITTRLFHARHVRVEFDKTADRCNGPYADPYFTVSVYYNSNPDAALTAPLQKSWTGYEGCRTLPSTAVYSGLGMHEGMETCTCAGRCSQLGYSHAFVEGTTRCYCSDTVPSAIGPDVNCNLPTSTTQQYATTLELTSDVLTSLAAPETGTLLSQLRISLSSTADVTCKSTLAVLFGDGVATQYCGSSVTHRYQWVGNFSVWAEGRSARGTSVYYNGTNQITPLPFHVELVCPAAALLTDNVTCYVQVTGGEGVAFVVGWGDGATEPETTSPFGSWSAVGMELTLPPFDVGFHDNCPLSNYTQFGDTGAVMVGDQVAVDYGYLSAVDVCLSKPGDLHIQILRPLSEMRRTASSNPVLGCGGEVLVVDKGECNSTKLYETSSLSDLIVVQNYVIANLSAGFHQIENKTTIPLQKGDYFLIYTGGKNGLITSKPSPGKKVNFYSITTTAGIETSFTGVPTSHEQTLGIQFIITNSFRYEMKHMYASRGKYDVTLTKGTAPPLSSTVEVIEPVRNASVYKPPCAAVGIPFEMMLNASGQDVQVLVDFGDGTNLSVPLGPVTHNYTLAGNYLISIIFSNSISGILINCLDFEVVHEIKGLQIAPCEEGVLTGTSHPSGISLQSGSGMNVSIFWDTADFGLLNFTTTNTTVSVRGDVLLIGANQTFPSPAVLTLTAFVSNAYNNVTNSCRIFVEEQIKAFTILPLEQYYRSDKPIYILAKVDNGTAPVYNGTLRDATPLLFNYTDNNMVTSKIEVPDIIVGNNSFNICVSNHVTPPQCLTGSFIALLPVSGVEIKSRPALFVATDQNLMLLASYTAGDMVGCTFTLENHTLGAYDPLNYTATTAITKVGTYRISTTCSNPVSNDTGTGRVTAMVPIRDMTLTCDSPQPIKMPVISCTLESGLLHPTQPQCIVDPGDGTAKQYFPKCILPLYFNHSYSAIGTSNLTVIVKNNVSELAGSHLSIILEKPCHMPKCNIANAGDTPLNASLRRTRTADVLQLVTDNLVECKASRATLFQWSVRKYTELADPLSLVNMSELNTTQAKLIVPPFSLTPGVYEATFTIRMVHPVTGEVKCVSKKYFEVVKSPLSCHIFGGSARTDGNAIKGEVDASASFDPDSPPHTDHALHFMWYCWAVDPTQRAQLLASGHKDPLSHLEPPLGANLTTGCFGQFPGLLSFNGSRFEYDAGMRRTTSMFVIALKLSKDSRVQYCQQVRTLLDANVPSVSSRCKGNCNDVCPAMKTTFLGASLEPLNDLLLDWDLLFAYNNSDIDINNKTLTEPTAQNIVFKPDALQPGVRYKLRLNALRKGEVDTGFSEIAFQTNIPPLGGSCSVSPAQGHALTTQFTVTCVSWSDVDEPLSLDVYIRDGAQDTLIAYGAVTSVSFVLPVTPSTKNVTDLKILIKDSFGCYSKRILMVNVSSDGDMLSTIETLLNQDGTVMNMILAGNTKDASQLIAASSSLLVEMLKSYTAAGDSPLGGTTERDGGSTPGGVNETAVNILTTMIERVVNMTSQIPIVSMEDVKQISGTLASITGVTSSLTPTAQQTLVNTLMESVSVFSARASLATPEDAMITSSALVTTVGNIAKSVKDSTLMAMSAYGVILANRTDSEPDISSDPDMQRCLADKQQAEAIQAAAISALEFTITTLVNSLRDHVTAGEMDTDFVSDHLNMTFSKVYGTGLANKSIMAGEAIVLLPLDPNVIFTSTNLSADTEVTLSLHSMDNIYLADDGADNVNGRTSTFEMSTTNGTASARDMSSPAEISLLHDDALPAINTTRFKLTANLPHSINVTYNDSSIHAQVELFECSVNVRVYLRREFEPTVVDYDYMWTLPRNDTPPGVDNRTVFVSNVDLNRTAAGQYFLLVTPDTHDVIELSPNCSYILQSYTGSCLYRNVSTQAWMGDGCEVIERSSPRTTICSCNHFTTFGSGFFVAPNPINFSEAFKGFSNLSDNPAVFSVVVSVIGLYIILVIFARRADNSDVRKVGVTVLPDNDPRDRYSYEISIHTGFHQGCGTTARVYIQLIGSISDSHTTELRDANRPRFQRGAIDQFLFTVPESLGKLEELRIWHDNSGLSPGWFLFKVQVRDVQTDQKWWFVCNNWLAVDENDGSVDRTLTVANKKDLAKFNILFVNATRRNLLDGHLWLSVVTRPPKSTFTRVQRLTCCLVLLLTTMVSNAMFYQVGPGNKDTTITLGPFRLSWSTVMIGLQSSVIVIPVNMLIVTVFRKLAPKQSKASKYEPGPYSEFADDAQSHAMPPKRSTLSSKHSIKKQQSQTSEGPPSFGNLVVSPGGSCTSVDAALADVAIDEKETLRKEKVADEKESSKCSWRSVIGFFSNKDDSDEDKKKSKFLFPHWCLYANYVLAFLTCFACALFTCLYGFTFGKTKSEEWISSMLVSFTQSVVVVQPAKVLLLAAFFALIIKDPDKEEDDADDEMELVEDAKHGDDEVREKKALFVKPPDLEKLQQARQLRLKQREMQAIIREIIGHLTVVLIVLFVAFANHDDHGFRFSSEASSLLTSLSSSGPSFDTITNSNDYWGWTTETVASALYPIDALIGYRYTGIMRNKHNSNVIGLGRIRQLRIKKETCQPPSPLRHLSPECNAVYSWSHEDMDSYLPHWAKHANETEAQKAALTKSPWRYQDTWELRGFPYLGKMATYRGGGYVQDLGPDNETLYQSLKNLASGGWIDQYTRALFTEVNIYNNNVNLLCVVTLLFEFLPSTGGIPFVNVQPIKLFRYLGGFSHALLGFEVVFLFLIFYWVYRDVKKIIDQGKAYWKGLWNVVDSLITSLSICAVGFYFARLVFINVAIKQFREDPKRFVSFQYVILLNEAHNCLMAVVVLLLNLKFLRLLRFNRKISMLSATVKLAAKPLFAYALVIFLVILAFAFLGTLMFGTQLPQYRTLTRSVVAFSEMMLGKFDFYELAEANRAFGPGLIFIYQLAMQFILLNLFIGILCESFEVVRSDALQQPNEYEIVNYMTNRIKSYFGQTVAPPIKPTYKKPLTELERNVDQIENHADTILYYMRNLFSEDLRASRWLEPEHDTSKKGKVMALFLEQGEEGEEIDENEFFDSIPVMDDFLERTKDSELEDIFNKRVKSRSSTRCGYHGNPVTDSESSADDDTDDCDDDEEQASTLARPSLHEYDKIPGHHNDHFYANIGETDLDDLYEELMNDLDSGLYDNPDDGHTQSLQRQRDPIVAPCYDAPKQGVPAKPIYDNPNLDGASDSLPVYDSLSGDHH